MLGRVRSRACQVWLVAYHRKPGHWVEDIIQPLVASCEEMWNCASARLLVEFAGFNVVVQTRASNRVMAANMEQPGARWWMFLRGTCLCVEGGEKKVRKSQEEGIWGEKSESLIPQQMDCEGFPYWKHYKCILLTLTRPLPISFLSHSLRSYFRPSPPSSDFLLFHHFPPHSQPPTLPRILEIIKSAFLQLLVILATNWPAPDPALSLSLLPHATEPP